MSFANRKNITNSAKIIVLGIVIAISAFVFKSEQNMALSCAFPYYSGAANFKELFDWRFSPDEYEKIAHMSNKDHWAYHYGANNVTIKSTAVNNYGYVLALFAARNIFPWLGDLQAVAVFQTLVHICFSLLIYFAFLQNRFQRGMFFLLYAINPVVLSFVTLPFYYFWAFIPSIALAAVWLQPDKIQRWIPFLSISIFFSFLIRPTTLFLILFVFVVAFWRNRQKSSQRMVVMSFVVFVSISFWFSQQGVWYGSPFHTAFVGIGNYSNPYGLHGGDSDGYEYYRQKTGEPFSYNPVAENGVNNPKVMARYQSVLKKRYFEIMKESPLLLVRNAVLNTVQAFGVGINVSREWTRPITAGIGLMVIALFLYTKQWVWGLGVLSYAVAFTLYYPPIVTYLLGVYPLTILGTCSALEQLLLRFWPEHRFVKLLLTK
jgi:hypothetical protein